VEKRPAAISRRALASFFIATGSDRISKVSTNPSHSRADTRTAAGRPFRVI
jgi:hypothetical protein